MGLIDIGLTGLRAHQQALNVTGNNVTNANTPGFSRREAIFESNDSQNLGSGFIGTGVSIVDIQRLNSEFVNSQLRSDTTLFNAQDTLLSNIRQLDNLLGNENTGLNAALNEYFSAVQGAAEDPQSIAQRQVLLNRSESLVNRFQSLNSRIDEQLRSVNQQLSATIAEVNGLAQGIAELNVAIAGSPGIAQGNDPNNLLDQRDQKLKELSQFVQLRVVEQDNRQVNVLVGNGQGLVVGDTARNFGLVPNPLDASRQELAVIGSQEPQVISRDLSGGQIGGLLEYRENALRPAQREIGRIAIGLAEQVNEQHALGLDLDGELGGLYFNDVNDRQRQLERVKANENNAPPNDRVIGVEITDSNQLGTDNFILEIQGTANDQFTLKRESNGEVVRQGRFPTGFPAEIQMPGFNIFLESGNFQAGDEFLIEPTRNGARDFGLVLERPEDLALASPIRAEADLGNTGSGQISQGTMLDVTNPLTNQVLPAFANPGQLTPPLAVRFTSETTFEVVDVSDPANPQPLDPPLNNERFQPGVTNTLFTDDPGQTIVTMEDGGVGVLNAPSPAALPAVPPNGYTAQTVDIQTRDPDTGITTVQSTAIAAGDSAGLIASKLSALDGVQATGYTQVNLANFTDNTNGTLSTVNITVNGTTVSLTPSGGFTADNLETAIQNDPNFESLGLEVLNDGNQINLRSPQGDDISITLTGGGGDSLDVQKVNPYGGGPAVQTLNDNESITVGGVVDVKLANGVRMTADPAGNVFDSSPAAQSSYTGFQFELSGAPEPGDIFTIGFNEDGVGDNRNGLAMASLANQRVLGEGTNTFGDAYASVVESVGTRTNRAQLDQEASQTLLEQSENLWQSESGVNLDEEAGRLVQFQTAYNASAQVVSIARDLFNTLIGTFQ